MSTNTVPAVSTSGDFPFSIYTIRGSRFLAADHKNGGAGEFTENKRWTSALGFLDSARKAGQRLPLLFAAGESIRGVIYFAYIDDLFVSPPDENGNGTTKVRFSALRPLRPKHPLSSLILRSSGEPLSDYFIKPYAICHTPDFLPPPLPQHPPVAGAHREASSTKKALKLRTFRHGDAPKRGEGLRIGTTRRPPRGKTKDQWGDYFDVWFPILAPSDKLLASRPFGFARYERELYSRAESRQALQLLAHIALRTPISIGCYCEDESHCHRSYLHKLIEREASKL